MRLIVMGLSQGGVKILNAMLPELPATLKSPILIAQHLPEDMPESFIQHLNDNSPLAIKEAEHNESIQAQHIYFAPPGYHLYVESSDTLALSVDSKVNYSRPSIDILFESAAKVFTTNLLAIIFSGANHDGAHGANCIKSFGGEVLIQSPSEAECSIMPEAARHLLGYDIQQCDSLETIHKKIISNG